MALDAIVAAWRRVFTFMEAPFSGGCTETGGEM